MKVDREKAASVEAVADQFTFSVILRWSAEDWMFTTTSFSLFTGIIMVMSTPGEGQDVNASVFISSLISFTIVILGLDWIHGLKISDIPQASRRFRLRCIWMILGPALDLLVLVALLLGVGLMLLLVGMVSGALAVLALIPGGLLVVKCAADIRNGIMSAAWTVL